MKKRYLYKLTYSIFYMFAFVILASCGGSDTESSSYTYQQPIADDDWPTDEPNNVGLDNTAFESMINRQDLAALNIHSILVVKDGVLVFEHYFPGRASNGNSVNFNQNTPHEMFSVTKSIASLLIGIAIDNQNISSVNDLIVDYLPAYSDHFDEEEKTTISVHHSLTMQTGIQWGELNSTNTTNSFRNFIQAEDPLDYLFSQPSTSTPGSEFEYNTGIASSMSEIIQTASSQRVDVFAQDYLFIPLNITDISWQQHSNGLIYSGTGLNMRPRDMAKIGSLILNQGNWKNVQVVPTNWINASTQTQVILPETFTADSYGYYWWIRDFQVNETKTTQAIYAAGYGGQMIFVLPEYDTVIVFTAGNFNGQNTNLAHAIMEFDIVPNLEPIR